MRRGRKLLVCLLIFISSELWCLQAARISELVEADLECNEGVCKLGSIVVEANGLSQEKLNRKDNSNINYNVNTPTMKESLISKSTKKTIRLILKPFFATKKFISNFLARFLHVSGGCVQSAGYILLRVSETCDSVITSVFQSIPLVIKVNIIIICLIIRRL